MNKTANTVLVAEQAIRYGFSEIYLASTEADD
jgi:hypothetical protein